MKDFGEFNIKPKSKGFVGEKVSINKILNVPIVVEAFKTGPSKFEGKSDRLDMQILFENKQRVVFVSSASLIEMIKSVPDNGFPFKARIVKEDSGRLVFASAQ